MNTAPGQLMKKSSFVTKYFCAIGVFNEADTLESSAILIYSQLQMGLYAQNGWLEAVVIKTVIKRVSFY